MNWPLPHIKLLDDLSFLLLVCSLQLFWAVYTSDKESYTYDVHNGLERGSPKSTPSTKRLCEFSSANHLQLPDVEEGERDKSIW